MKPRIFIASSVESLPIARSVQELLEHNAEPTIWTQGIFNLSESSLDSLIKSLNQFDFGIFVVGAEDVVKLKGTEYRTARDNVIFELGLFIGKLGKERSFILAPRNQKDFHLPTDLLGVNPADYEANRSDKNLLAALGPACNKILRVVESLGFIGQDTITSEAEPEQSEYDDVDIINLLATSIMTKRDGYKDLCINYRELDEAHGFVAGTASKFIDDATVQTGTYKMKAKGKNTAILSYRIVV